MHSKVVPLECARSARKFLGIVVYRKNFASCVSNFFGGVSYRNFLVYRWCIVKKRLHKYEFFLVFKNSTFVCNILELYVI